MAPFHLLPTPLRGARSYFHFADGETEAQGLNGLAKAHACTGHQLRGLGPKACQPTSLTQSMQFSFLGLSPVSLPSSRLARARGGGCFECLRHRLNSAALCWAARLHQVRRSHKSTLLSARTPARPRPAPAPPTLGTRPSGVPPGSRPSPESPAPTGSAPRPLSSPRPRPRPTSG